MVNSVTRVAAIINNTSTNNKVGNKILHGSVTAPMNRVLVVTRSFLQLFCDWLDVGGWKEQKAEVF
jgi:hypothetical protein